MEKDKAYIRHILDAISAIETYTEGFTLEMFLEDGLVQDGVVRQLEIIGEATKNLSSDFRDCHEDIPWKDMAGMRDKLIHIYFGVDLEVVWHTVKEDFPKLKEQVLALLED